MKIGHVRLKETIKRIAGFLMMGAFVAALSGCGGLGGSSDSKSQDNSTTTVNGSPVSLVFKKFSTSGVPKLVDSSGNTVLTMIPGSSAQIHVESLANINTPGVAAMLKFDVDDPTLGANVVPMLANAETSSTKAPFTMVFDVTLNRSVTSDGSVRFTTDLGTRSINLTSVCTSQRLASDLDLTVYESATTNFTTGDYVSDSKKVKIRLQ